MSKEYNSVTKVVDLSLVLQAWADQYEPTDGSEILTVDHYVDVTKQKVVFVINTMKDKE